MLKKYFALSDFARNTFSLIIGTAIAQSIPFILQPLLRRIYSAEDFGAMSVYLSILANLSIVSALRYDTAIVLPKEDKDAARVFALTVITNIAFALLVFLVVFFFHEQVIQLINFPRKYAFYLYLLPLAAMIFSIYQGMNFWLIRKKAFTASTKNKIVRRGVEGGVQVLFGFLRVPGGLFLADLAGNFANIFTGWRQMLKKSFSMQFIHRDGIRKMAAEYRHFPLYNVVPTFLSSVASVLPFLLVNKFYSTETAGYLDLTRLVLTIPMIFVSATVSQVLFQQISDRKNHSLSISGDIKKIVIIQMVIILIELFLILPFGPALFGWAFGDQYSISGEFARLLIFSFAANFISSTFTSVFIALNKIRLNSLWQVVYFIFICSLMFFNDLGIEQFLKIFVTIDITFQLLYCFAIFYVVRNYENGIKEKNVSR